MFRTSAAALFAISFLCSAGGISAQSKRAFPGIQLNKTSKEGKAGNPARNSKNVIANATSPACPHIGQSLRALLIYARTNHPSIFRQAVAVRRSGSSQAATRDWLEQALCTADGF